MKKLLCVLAAMLCVLLIAGSACAEEPTEAEDITDSTVFSGSGYDSFRFLRDKKNKEYYRSAGDTVIHLNNEEGMYSLYLMFHLEYGEYTITDNTTGAVFTAGKYGFLHEYIDLLEAFGSAPTSITIALSNGTVRMSELYVFGQGTPPAHVQVWQPPLDEGADLLLLSTHGDDEQLFFAGLLPKYASELGYRVQVAYMTDHRNNTYTRVHEMLNGLWAVGVTHYPVFGDFADVFVESLKGTYYDYSLRGITRDDVLEFVVEQLRRFRPQVVVGHDINGEYGHGMHMVYTDTLMEALEITADGTYFPESAEAYGLWDVPKTYLHLYEENPVVIDYDQPLESFDGMTAFEVTQKLGYPCHETQQFTWFTKWINGKNQKITKASEIETYSPCQFGLYRSLVGEDVMKDDFMENIISYDEQERLAEEKRLEEERQKAEEAARREEERRKAEEAARREEEQRKKEEQERLAAEKLEMIERQKAAEQARRTRDLTIAVCILMGLILALFVVVGILLVRQNRRFKKSLKK